jgi:hypothetical protein
LKPAQYAEIAAFNKKAKALQRALNATTTAAAELAGRLEVIKTSLQQAEKPDEAAQRKVRDLIERVRLVRRDLSGDTFLSGRNENAPLSLSDRVRDAIWANRGAIALPTGTQKRVYAEASKQLAAEIGKLRQILEKELPALEKRMEAIGAPWAPGQLPKWDGK